MPDDRLHSEGLRDLAALHQARQRIRDLEDERNSARQFGHGPNGNGSAFNKAIVAGLVGLFLAFVAGGIVLYREMGEVKAIGAENARVGADNARRIEWLYQQLYNRERR